MINKLTNYIGNITAVSVVFLVLLVVYDAMARYIFSSGSIALQELEWHLFDVIIMLGIVYTQQQNSHVRVDIFYANYSQKTKALVDMVSSIFFVLPFSMLIIYLGIDFVYLSFTQNEISSNPGGLEYRYLVKSLLPLAFIFLVLQTVNDFLKNYKIWREL